MALHFHLLRLHFVDRWIVIDDFAVNLHEHGLLERNLFRKLLPLVRALGWYIAQQTASVMQKRCLPSLFLPLGFHHGRARIRLCTVSGPSRLRLDVFIIPLHESLSPRPSHGGRIGLIVRGLGICDLFRRVQNGDLRWWHRISAAKNFSGLSSWDRLQLQDGWREGGDRLCSLIEDWLFSEVVPLLVAVALLKLPIRFNFVFLELRELQGQLWVYLYVFEDFRVEQAPRLHLFLKVSIRLLLFLDRPLYSFGWLANFTLAYAAPLMIKVALEKSLWLVSINVIIQARRLL